MCVYVCARKHIDPHTHSDCCQNILLETTSSCSNAVIRLLRNYRDTSKLSINVNCNPLLVILLRIKKYTTVITAQTHRHTHTQIYMYVAFHIQMYSRTYIFTYKQNLSIHTKCVWICNCERSFVSLFSLTSLTRVLFLFSFSFAWDAAIEFGNRK